jgi:dTDP-4-dehydrorhamnose 3,5-epimerase-like enzyme
MLYEKSVGYWWLWVLGSKVKRVYEERYHNEIPIYLPDNYLLITVPPMIWNGFKGIGTGVAIVANCASIPHDPNEIERLDPFDPSIPYDWNIKNR